MYVYMCVYIHIHTCVCITYYNIGINNDSLVVVLETSRRLVCVYIYIYTYTHINSVHQLDTGVAVATLKPLNKAKTETITQRFLQQRKPQENKGRKPLHIVGRCLSGKQHTRSRTHNFLVASKTH